MIRGDEESVYDVGSNPISPHTLLSSRRHFRKPGLEGSRQSRAYAGSSRVGKSDVATYLVQIVDKPHRIIALKALYTSMILLPIKYAAELIVKPG